MQSARPKPIGKGEFIALIAMMSSIIAFSIDAILPAFPQISADFQAKEDIHLTVTVFLIGLAIGTLFAGPISDAIGRHKIVYAGVSLYVCGGLLAWYSTSFELLLIARALQGLGAAGPRVASMAAVRDLYSGRDMAQILSFSMALFALVPFFAPTVGMWITTLLGWRYIFASFVLFMTISTLWMAVRLPEPLPVENRRPFRITQLLEALKEVFDHRIVKLSIAAQCVVFSILITIITQVQPIYDQEFGRAESFAYWFGVTALFASVSTSLLNAVLVIRLGMVWLVRAGMFGVAIASMTLAGLFWAFPELQFGIFIAYQFMMIWLASMMIGNLNALALEPMGHIAGLTSALSGFFSTFVSALFASAAGWITAGQLLPLIAITFLLGLLGAAILIALARAVFETSKH